MSDDMLFDVSPIHDEDGKKKKGGKAKKPKAQPQERSADDYLARLRSAESSFLMRSLECVSCDNCGAPADLEEVFEFEGIKTWRVRCGWWCLHSWLIEEIPGVLPERKRGSYRLHGGRFAGMTLEDVWGAGERWYIESLASGVGGTKSSTAAAKEFLAEKSG